MINKALAVAGMGAVMGAVGCTTTYSTTVPDETKYKELVPIHEKYENMGPERSRTVLRSRTPTDENLSKIVSINNPSMSLANVLMTAVPDMQVNVRDGFVNLNRRIPVLAQGMTLNGFLEYLTAVTDYEYRVRGNSLYVSSVATRSWNIAAFSSNRSTSIRIGGERNSLQQQSQGNGGSGSSSGGGDERGARTQVVNTEDEWDSIVAAARSILEGPTGGSISQSSIPLNGPRPVPTSVANMTLGDTAPDPQLVAVRSLGLIKATASPKRILQLDGFLSEIEESSTRQVHLDVKAYEVSLADSRGRGIDWQALGDFLYDQGEGVLNLALTSSAQPALSVDPGAFSVAATTQFRDFNASAILNFLSSFGETELLNQPNITVLNGKTANFNSGDEFSYLARITQTVTGDNILTTPEFERILVGVTLAVTPRILSDDRVMIEVIPIISSLKGFTDFQFDGAAFSAPNIALQELATQVIARPGETVHLGGLITERFTEQMKGLPRDRNSWNPLDKMLGLLFDSVANEVERRELVLTITPSIVEG